MITSVKEMKTMKAIDLPHTFDIRVGAIEYPFEIDGVDEGYVYIKDTTNNEIVYIPRDEMITILVPDTWENAKWDIALGLMNEGIL